MSEYKLLDEFEQKLNDDRVTISEYYEDGGVALVSESWDKEKYGEISVVNVFEVNSDEDTINNLNIIVELPEASRHNYTPEQAVRYVETKLLE